MAFALVMCGKLELSEFSPLQYLVNTLNSAARSGEAWRCSKRRPGSPEVRQRLYQPLRQGTRDEKIGLARVMAHSGDKDSIPLLEALSRDANVDVASEALRALRTLRARLQ